MRLLGLPRSSSTARSRATVATWGAAACTPGTPPQFANTIIAGNTGTNPDFSGTCYSLGFNLVGDATGSTGFGMPGSHDQVGAVGNPIDPNLAPLGDYGGPTWTMPPRPGSPAVDQGDAYSSVDQRGRTRFYDQPSVLNMIGGDASDIGAYEVRPGLRTVTTLADAGAGSLRQAVADLHPFDADSIKFAANVRGTITLTTGVITCTKPGVIDGPGSWDLAIHGNDAGRVFVVNPNTTFEILGLTLTGGRETDGMAALALGNLTLRKCRIVGNHVLPGEFNLGGAVREFPRPASCSAMARSRTTRPGSAAGSSPATARTREDSSASSTARSPATPAPASSRAARRRPCSTRRSPATTRRA